MAAVSDTNLFGLVKEKTLTEKWSQYKQPLLINDDDWTSSFVLFYGSQDILST